MAAWEIATFSKRRYIQWFEKHLGKYYLYANLDLQEGMKEFNGYVCYALRCAFLHAGNDDLSLDLTHDTVECIMGSRPNYDVHCRFRFSIGGYDGHSESRDLIGKTELYNIEIDLPRLCEHICTEARTFMENWNDKPAFEIYSFTAFDTYKWNEDRNRFYSED